MTITGFRTETTRVNGVDLHVRSAGSGPPLLYLHPAFGFQDAVPFFQPITERYRVIAPDHPGFGSSGTPEWLRSIADLAYSYLEFLQEHDLHDVRIIGSSLGGWIAAEMAVRDPSRISGLVLLAPAGLRVKGVESGDIFLWTRAELAENLYAEPELARAILKAEPDPASVEVELKNRYTAARVAWEPRLFNPELARWAHRIRMPTLLLWGENDRVLPPAYAEAWTSRLPNIIHSVVPHCGHLPEIEAGKIAADHILTFLARAGS